MDKKFRLALILWLPTTILLLVSTNTFSTDAVEGDSNTTRAEKVDKVIPVKSHISELHHEEDSDVSHVIHLKETASNTKREKKSIATEAAEVMEEFPYLKYATSGDEACREQNTEWERRIKLAYETTTSDEEIGGREGIHLFFTTDCTQHSLWQAMTLEYTWAKVKQPGAITRIVSGCFSHSGEPNQLKDLMAKRVIENPKSFIFFGPRVGGAQSIEVTCGPTQAGWYEGQFLGQTTTKSGIDECKKSCRKHPSCVSFNLRSSDKECYLFATRSTFHNEENHDTGECTRIHNTKLEMPQFLSTYAPINRPATALYWLQHAKPRERVLGLLDPDMVFIKPLLFHFSGDNIVEEGRPVGQFYDYLVTQDWDKYYTDICVDKDVCKPLGNKKDFAPGPPHLMTRSDWSKLAPWWLRYTVGAKKLWGAWTSEMAGMSIGMARLGLRSRLEPNGMWDRSPAAYPALEAEGLFSSMGDGWKRCAAENEFCTIPSDSAEHEVRYGEKATEKYSSRNASAGQQVLCSHRVTDVNVGYFSREADPASGESKSCFIQETDRKTSTFVPDGSALWTYCGQEGEHCKIPPGDTYSVRFGISSVDQFVEVTGVEGGDFYNCLFRESEPKTFTTDPAPGAKKYCYFKPEGPHPPPPSLLHFIPQSRLPSLFHYCFTLEINRPLWKEQFWHYATPQKRWENENHEPLLKYMHWSKYRSLTDWPGNQRRETLMTCDQPMLFEFPPLPVMTDLYSSTSNDRGWQVFFSAIMPAVNAALTHYKLRNCKGKINLQRTVRTAHDSFWISDFETITNTSDSRGYSFRNIKK